MNKNPPQQARIRLGTHWRTVSWSLLDKSLPLWFGLAFMLLVVRALPEEEFALQFLAGTILLTLSQFFRSLVLVPLIRFVAEHGAPARLAATGTLLYVGASASAALVLAGAREAWAALFDKPGLAPVLVPSACLLACGSARDAALACLEGLRRLRTLFVLDAVYYATAIAALAVWAGTSSPRTAVAVQWLQAGAAAWGTIVAVVTVRRALFVRPGREEARRLVAFGTSFLGSGIGATLSQNADTFVAGRMLDATDVAAYGAARTLFRVFNVLAQAINQVVMPVVARLDAAGRRADLRVLFEKSVCFVALALLPAAALLVVLTGPLLQALYGPRYDAAVRPFQILVVGAALSLPLASVGSPFLTGMGRLGTLLWITWSGLVLGIVLAVAWIPRWGPSGAAAAAAAAALWGMATRAWVLRRIVGFEPGGIVRRTRDAVQFARGRLGARRRP